MTDSDRIARVQNEIRGVASQYGVSSWERSFLADVEQWARDRKLSAKQEAVLAKIEKKVFQE